MCSTPKGWRFGGFVLLLFLTFAGLVGPVSSFAQSGDAKGQGVGAKGQEGGAQTSPSRPNPFKSRIPASVLSGSASRSAASSAASSSSAPSPASRLERDPLMRSEWVIGEAFGLVDPRILGAKPTHDFPYEILFKERRIRFLEEDGAILATMQNHVRIKIHNDDPQSLLDASLVTIPVRRDEDLEILSDIEGMTHHPDGSYTLLSDKDIRRVQLNAQVDLVEFILPAVTAGSVIEYRFIQTRKVIEELPEFHFSERVPVRRASIHILHQPWIRYEHVLSDPGNQVRFIPERMDTSSVQRVFSIQGPEPVFIAHWIAEDVSPEELVYESLPSRSARTGIRLMIGEFGLPRQPLDNSWAFVDARLRRISDPFASTREAARLTAIGESLAVSNSDPIAIIQGALEVLKGAALPKSIPSIFPAVDNLDSILEKQTTDQAQLNLALMAILRGAGLDARPVYHSDRGFGEIDTLFPTINQFQRVLVAVLAPVRGGAASQANSAPQANSASQAKIVDNALFLDAAYVPSITGLIPPESSRQRGFMLSEKGGFDWVQIQGDRSRYASDLDFTGRLTVDGALQGLFTAKLSGYSARATLLALQQAEDASEYLKAVFFDRYETVEVSDVRIQDAFSDSGSLEITSNVVLEGYAIRFTDGLDFTPLMVGFLQDHSFSAEQRKTPLELDAPERLSVQVRLTLPRNVAPPISVRNRQSGSDGVFLSEAYATSSSMLSYTLTLDRPAAQFSVAEYPGLRDVYERWVELSTKPWRLAWK